MRNWNDVIISRFLKVPNLLLGQDEGYPPGAPRRERNELATSVVVVVVVVKRILQAGFPTLESSLPKQWEYDTQGSRVITVISTLRYLLHCMLLYVRCVNLFPRKLSVMHYRWLTSQIVGWEAHRPQ